MYEDIEECEKSRFRLIYSPFTARKQTHKIFHKTDAPLQAANWEAYNGNVRDKF